MHLQSAVFGQQYAVTGLWCLVQIQCLQTIVVGCTSDSCLPIDITQKYLTVVYR